MELSPDAANQHCLSAFLFIYLFILRQAWQIIHAELLDPGARDGRKNVKKEPWKSYKKKKGRGWALVPLAGQMPRRCGQQHVKYLCVTVVFIAFSAAQPAGGGFSRSSLLIKSLLPTHPLLPHPLGISIQRQPARGGRLTT